ncbi:Hypp2084 [Branchiostoma lanceolatum]|nr:Hypp2084 [Branchiostoma lanceolatum]
MQVLREQQQMRDDYERETAELKQRLMVLYHAVTMLNLEQQQFLETIGEKEEQDPRILKGTKRESSEDRDDSLPACTSRQDTYGHNYNDQQMLEFQNHLQRRANRTAPQDRMYGPQQERASGVWKGKPPSPAEEKTPHVTTLTHYMKTQSTFTIHLGHCHICKKTIEALLHGARCLEDGCATCQQIAREVAKHITRCTRGTLCPVPICASGVPLGLYGDGTEDETPMFVGLVRLYLRRTFSRG